VKHAALFSAASCAALSDDLRHGQERSVGGPARAAVIDPTPERLERARTIVERGKPWRGRDGVWFSPEGLLAAAGSLAFVFPGVDASFEPRVDDLAARFGLPVPACTAPRDLTETGIGIIGVNSLLDRVLRDLGFCPAHVAGHSIGEWSGLLSTGIVPAAVADEFVSTLRPGAIKVPGVVFAAAGCGVDRANAALRDLPDISLTHDNCPHQILFCGQEASVETAIARLREDSVLCQKLPFQSGFHSPLLADYLGPHRDNFARIALRPPRTPLWSATTVERYPHDADAIRALSIEHLVRPVRFRELIERLYAEGARVFVQVGTGSVVNFVEDTLRGRPHLAIAANVKDRSGLDQLRRVLAALFVEGAHASPELAATPAPPAPAPPAPPSPPAASTLPATPAMSTHPLAAEFVETMELVASAQRDVLAALASPPSTREVALTRTLSLETMPEILDHSFVRQPPGWSVMSDRQPVVPMTTSMELMIEHALAMVPGRVAVGVQDVRAYRWLVVAPPVDLKVTARFDGADRVHVRLDDYAEGTVVLGQGYPAPPPADVAPLTDAAPAAIDALRVYEDRFLFHGPAFRGIVDLGVLGSDGIRGTIESGAARGALLDNAGQLYGYWVITRTEVDRMAMPVRIPSVRFYGPHPEPGARLECTVRVRSLEARSVVADLSLARGGRAWCVIDGWEDRRFELHGRLWDVMAWPEKNLLAVPQPEGFVLFEDGYRAAPTRDRLARRFLGEAERADYERQGPRKQRAWLSGRVAAKDAVRDLLWRSGHGPLFPVEVSITSEDSGRPLVSVRGGRDLRVSIAHKDDLAVALAREGRAPGIDVERVEKREDSFAELSFTAAELGLVEGEPRDEAWTRLWTAKEAAAKAAGTGLGGSPRRFPVRDRAGTRLLVGDCWINTKRHGDFVIGWTEA
jgi:acyl transferase domain-containing protein